MANKYKWRSYWNFSSSQIQISLTTMNLNNTINIININYNNNVIITAPNDNIYDYNSQCGLYTNNNFKTRNSFVQNDIWKWSFY